MKHIDALIGDGGEITVGPADNIDCAASAADGSNTLALLARRDGETLGTLLKRLDRAIGRYYETDETTDEDNRPPAVSSAR